MNIKCEILENVNLKEYNTYRLEAFCKYMAFPKSVKELQEVINYCLHKDIKYFVLGNGSNVILDGTFNGIVINMKNLNGSELVGNTDIIAYSGIMMPKLVKFAVKNNLQGLEWASGIPGTLGGGIYGNCGAYNDDIYHYLKEIIVLHNGKIEHIKADKVFHGYRQTFFQGKRQYIIVAAHLKLIKGDSKQSQELINDRLKRRLSSQPLTYPSAGSVFRNPSKLMPSGKLIEDVGLKNKNIGGALISPKHANFIVNNGNATAKDVISLIEQIKKTIKENYSIDLVTEQEIVKWDSNAKEN